MQDISNKICKALRLKMNDFLKIKLFIIVKF